jgi:hypothetical protein
LNKKTRGVRSSLILHPSPIPRPYGCSVGSGRDDATKGGRRRDATSDLILKHPNIMVATYIRRQLKHFEHAYETLEKYT